MVVGALGQSASPRLSRLFVAGGRLGLTTPMLDLMRKDITVDQIRDAFRWCRDAGLEPRRFRTGGGSDGNVLSAKGLPSLVLSSGMRNVHGTGESVAVADLNSLVGLVLAVVRRAKG